MRKIKEPQKEQPMLLDEPINNMRDGLKEHLVWLDQSFGRVYKNIRNIGNKKYVEPCLYVGKNNYETLIPSADLGNYCFFVLNDPTEIDDFVVRASCSIIFFVDLRKCFGNNDIRDTERIKNDIIRVIKQDIFLKRGWYEIDRIYEDGKNVYRDFTIDENDNQFTMQPYACFRVDGRMNKYIETC